MAYTKAMSFLIQPTSAPVAKTKNIAEISLGLATIFIVMVVAQLFTYEHFPKVIEGMWLPWSDKIAPVKAAVLVILEVVALPFLLRMSLSPAMRVVSMIAGWTATIGWLGLALWQNLIPHTVGNAGMLGDTISLPVGWWSVFVFAAIAVLVGWVSWGMWPLPRMKKK